MEQRNQSNQIMDMPANRKVTAKVFAAEFRLKREVFYFMSVDVGVYLLAYSNHCFFCPMLTLFFYSCRAGHNLLLERPHERKKEE